MWLTFATEYFDSMVLVIPLGMDSDFLKRILSHHELVQIR